MDWNMDVWSQMIRKREKEAGYSWLAENHNKALDTGLALLHIGTGTLPHQGLASPGHKVSSVGFCTPKN